MKKFAVLALLTISMFAVFAMPAQAASLRVSAKAANHANAGHVDFTAKVSRSSRVKVTILQGKRALRTITARRSGKSYSASWNLTDAKGSSVAPGTYSYTVTAAASKSKKSVKGKVVVPVPARIPVPVGAAAGTPSRWFGFFQQGMTSTSVDTLKTLESAVGTRAAVVNWFISDSDSFPKDKARLIAADGRVPMITLEFWSTQTGGVATIANGSKDAYLTKFADDAKAYGGEVWIRPLHEMNSNWYPWAGGTSGNSAAQVVASWIRMRNIFASRGATNVKFVWCVNNDSVPNTTANAIDKYWPGDANVDIVAIDAYNFGASDPSWSTWRSFGSAIDSSYKKVTALSAKPLIIAETGSVDLGGDKGVWVTDMFNSITTTYTRITGVCWFNVNDAASSNTDWRVDSSPNALAAFRAVVAKGF